MHQKEQAFQGAAARSSCSSRWVVLYSPPQMLRLYTYSMRAAAVPVKSCPGVNPKHQYSRVQERGQENKAAAQHVSTDQVTALQFGRRTCARSCPTSILSPGRGEILSVSWTELLIRSHRYRICNYKLARQKRRTNTKLGNKVEHEVFLYVVMNFSGSFGNCIEILKDLFELLTFKKRGGWGGGGGWFGWPSSSVT